MVTPWYHFAFVFFFFNDTATTEIYTFPYTTLFRSAGGRSAVVRRGLPARAARVSDRHRSEEHTSELQSRLHLVCRLLLGKKKCVGSVFDSGSAHKAADPLTYASTTQ